MYQYEWLEKLHNVHHATLLMLARNRLRAATGSTSEAEDVVQEVFLLAAEKNIQNVPNPSGWLIKATTILCMKRVEHIVRDGVKEQRFIQQKLDQSADRSVYAIERDESEIDSLLWLLFLEQVLSEKEWELMRKYCLLKIPLEEIAAEMGVSVSKLKVQICRIRKKLRKFRRDV